MKRCVMAVVLLLGGLSLGAAGKDPAYREARHSGALTRIELHIADDDGIPVGNAKVKAFLGMNFRPKGMWVEGLSDTNGIFVVSGKTCGDEIEVFVAKDGYYGSKVKYCYATMGAEHEVKDGKWQQYGAKENIVLRKIKNPIRIVSNEEGRYDFPIMATNVVIGFDMAKNDLVCPYGKGDTADFYLEFKSDGLPPNASKWSRLTITYPMPHAAAYEATASAQSEFKGCYSAECNRFSATPIVLENRLTGFGRVKDVLGEKKVVVIRSRCKVDEQGRLLSANYSILDHLSFSTAFNKPGSCRIIYHFNPKPNDTNLEFLRGP